ncbi:MAG: hypothetical protein IJD14_06210 [Christensenellaceae bacterium]|nr:hypothetical protein [Christensenellaceae bacterium]
MALIDNWKQVGRDFKDIGKGSVKDIGKGIGKTAKDFGKTMVKSVKHTAGKVDDWVNNDEEETAETETETEETPADEQ